MAQRPERNENGRVKLSPGEEQKRYYKYYLEDMAQPDPATIGKILSGPIRPDQAIPFTERNRVFDEFEGEVGYTVMPDGTGYLSNFLRMPGVTTEMFDWWFAWHCLDDLRYTIWDPEDHWYARTQNRVRALDPKLSYRERLWNTSHDIIEDIGMGPDHIFINFKNPGDMGFDVSRIGTEACSTLVCGNGYGVGQPPYATVGTFMSHTVRERGDGLELRSIFWFGWKHENGRDIKVLPDGMRVPPMGPMALLLHNVKEFTNLARLIPRVYAEEKDNF